MKISKDSKIGFIVCTNALSIFLSSHIVLKNKVKEVIRWVVAALDLLEVSDSADAADSADSVVHLR
jgi:hypothetical protein